MKLKLDASDPASVMLIGDDGAEIVISGPRAMAMAFDVARAVNRDQCFDALVSALLPFRSNEMGNLLVGIIDAREENGAEAQERLRRYVKMIDALLDLVERMEQDGDPIEA